LSLYIPIEERRKEIQKFPDIFSRIIASGYNIHKLKDITVAVFGCGGLGAELAVKLARTGISKFILVDKDTVGVENLNRMVYTREDAGKSKVDALAEKIRALRNNDEKKEFHINVKTIKDNVLANDKMCNKVFEKADIICCCFDNKEARIEVNWFFNSYLRNSQRTKNPILIDGGTSTDGLQGTIYTYIPYKTPCIECYKGSLIKLTDKEPEKPRVPCGASLATTMSMVSTLMADAVFKYIHGDTGNIKSEIRVTLSGLPGIITRNREIRKSCEACNKK